VVPNELEIEEVLLIAAVILLGLDLLQLARSKGRQDRRKLNAGFYATTIAVGLIVVSYAMFANMFLYDDFSVIETYSYSSSGLSSVSKLHAT